MEDNPAQAANTQPQPVGPTTSPNPEPKKSFPKWIIAVILVVVLILLGIGGYFLFQNQASKTQVNTVVVASPTTTTTPEFQDISQYKILDTTSWKPYTNTEYVNYSLKYKGGWTIDKEPSYNKSTYFRTPDWKTLDNKLKKTGFPYSPPPEIILTILDKPYIAPSDSNNDGNHIVKYIEVNGITGYYEFVAGAPLAIYHFVYPVEGGKKSLEVGFLPSTAKEVSNLNKEFGTHAENITMEEFKTLFLTIKTDQVSPNPTCKPRPACLDTTPRCMIAETAGMCPPTTTPSL